MVDVTKGFEAWEGGITPNNSIGRGVFRGFPLFRVAGYPSILPYIFCPCVHVLWESDQLIETSYVISHTWVVNFYGGCY